MIELDELANQLLRPLGLASAESGTKTTIKVPDRTLPIILVPGTMGSRLADPNGDLDTFSSLVWNPFGSPVGDDAWPTSPNTDEARQLLFDMTTPLVPAGDHTYRNSPLPYQGSQGATRFDQWVHNSYELVFPPCHSLLMSLHFNLRTKLALKGWKLHIDCCGYDWRLSCSDAAKMFLKPRVDEVMKRCNGEKPILIAHSMGGLVCRSYLWELSQRKNIRTLVLVGSPNLGATKPFHMLKNGVSFDPRDEAFDTSMAALMTVVLRRPLPDANVSFCRSMPSLYQLVARGAYVRRAETPTWIDYKQAHTGRSLVEKGAPQDQKKVIKTLEDPYAVLEDTGIGLNDEFRYLLMTSPHIVRMLALDRFIFEHGGNKHGAGKFHRKTLFVASKTHRTHVGSNIDSPKVVREDSPPSNRFPFSIQSRAQDESGDGSVPIWSAIPSKKETSNTTTVAKTLVTGVTQEHGDLLGDATFIEKFVGAVSKAMPNLFTREKKK